MRACPTGGRLVEEARAVAAVVDLPAGNRRSRACGVAVERAGLVGREVHGRVARHVRGGVAGVLGLNRDRAEALVDDARETASRERQLCRTGRVKRRRYGGIATQGNGGARIRGSSAIRGSQAAALSAPTRKCRAGIGSGTNSIWIAALEIEGTACRTVHVVTGYGAAAGSIVRRVTRSTRKRHCAAPRAGLRIRHGPVSGGRLIWPHERPTRAHRIGARRLDEIRPRVRQGAGQVDPAVAGLLLRAGGIGGAGETTDDHAVAEGRVDGLEQGGGASDDGGRGRRAVDHRVGAPQVRRLDIGTGRGDEDGLAGVAEAGEAVGRVGGGDAHDGAVAGGERRLARRVVTGGGHEDGALRPRVVDGILEVRAEAGVAEAHHDDVGAVVGGPHDTRDDVTVLTETVCIEHGDGHHAHARVRHAGDALGRHRVGSGGDDAGQPRAVAVRVGEAVPAVEDRGAGDDLAPEVGMGRVDAGVEHGDSRRAGGRDGPEGEVPTDLRQVPLVLVERVGRQRFRLADLVLLGPDHLRVGLVAGERGGEIGRGHGDHVQSEGRDRRGLHTAVPGDDGGLLIRGESRDELDDQRRRRRGRRLGEHEGRADEAQDHGRDNRDPLEHEHSPHGSRTDRDVTVSNSRHCSRRPRSLQSNEGYIFLFPTI